jgi:hypothetical protein
MRLAVAADNGVGGRGYRARRQRSALRPIIRSGNRRHWPADPGNAVTDLRRPQRRPGPHTAEMDGPPERATRIRRIAERTANAGQAGTATARESKHPHTRAMSSMNT